MRHWRLKTGCEILGKPSSRYGPDERLEAALKEALLKQEQARKEAEELEVALWPEIREEQIKAILGH